METHIIWVTVVVNWLLGKPVGALLSALHIRPENPQYPIPTHVSMELLVFGMSIVFFLWLKRRISVERPGATQQVMEWVLSNPMGVGVRDLLDDNVGHGAEKYVAMLGSIGIFVLFCNLISIVPTLESPTAEKSVPLGCAITVFLYYNWCGIRQHGALRYAQHFTGPEMPLPFPLSLIVTCIITVVETFSNLVRLLSLTVRLWVNMLVSEILYGLFLGLLVALFLFFGKLNVAGYISGVLPLFGPIIFIVLHIFVGVLQAFVFTVLPVVYVGGAVAEEH